jgi:GntR family transcriptional regulator, rspAB operon transcriptional repressor
MPPEDTTVDDRLGFLDGVLLSRQLPLSEQVYTLVRKAIVMGHLPPGAPINEPEIAGRLGISRTPVREAVKKVSDEGLVEVFAQHGTFVSDIRRAQVEEAYIIRIALEGESVERAAATISQRQLQDIEDIHQAHETAVRRTRYDEAIARDDDLHRAIAEVNGLHMVEGRGYHQGPDGPLPPAKLARPRRRARDGCPTPRDHRRAGCGKPGDGPAGDASASVDLASQHGALS